MPLNPHHLWILGLRVICVCISCVRERAKETETVKCHKMGHVVWIRIHKTVTSNYCHAGGAEQLIKLGFELFSDSFFFWVRTHVDHHAFFQRRLHSWPKKSSQLVFIITLPHSWQQDETLFSGLFEHLSLCRPHPSLGSLKKNVFIFNVFFARGQFGRIIGNRSFQCHIIQINSLCFLIFRKYINFLPLNWELNALSTNWHPLKIEQCNNTRAWYSFMNGSSCTKIQIISSCRNEKLAFIYSFSVSYTYSQTHNEQSHILEEKAPGRRCSAGTGQNGSFTIDTLFWKESDWKVHVFFLQEIKAAVCLKLKSRICLHILKSRWWNQCLSINTQWLMNHKLAHNYNFSI